MRKALEAAALLRDYARLYAALPGAQETVKNQPKKVLFLGYAAVGDLIFLLPSLKALRQGLPRARIVFAGDRDPGATELLPATKLVDEIWLYTHAELATEKTRAEIQERVLKEGFDAVIIGQATPLRPFARAILPIPIRIAHFRPIEAPHQGWSGPRYAFWRLRRGIISSEFERRWAINRPVWVKEEAEHAVARSLRLIDALGLPVPPPAQSRPDLPLPEAARRWAQEHLPDQPGVKTVGIHLGSPQSQYMKIWPAGRWGTVAKKLAKTYRCRIAIFGGPAEIPEVANFNAQFQGPAVDLVGKAGLLETFAAIGRCDLFLSSDTGLSKAAMAQRVPTLSVWGPISRKDTGVLWNPELHTEVSLDLSCSPCVSMALRKEGAGVINFSNCGHHNCLEQMTPQLVYDAIVKHHGQRLRG